MKNNIVNTIKDQINIAVVIAVGVVLLMMFSFWMAFN